MTNILDPKINGKRYRSGDELCDMLRHSFLGQVGMRIAQRPQGANVFKDEEGNFDKAAMDKFMDKIYIENVNTQDQILLKHLLIMVIEKRCEL